MSQEVFDETDRKTVGKKLVYVLFQYDNGEEQYLEGEECQRWLDKVDGIMGFHQLRGGHKIEATWEWKETPSSSPDGDEEGV